MNLTDEEIESLLDALEGSVLAEVTYVKEDGSFGQTVLQDGGNQRSDKILQLLGAMDMNQRHMMRILDNATNRTTKAEATTMEDN